MEVTPLWLDPATAPPGGFPAFPAPEGSARADLLVLGLGMTGASAALHAAERGLRVVAVDAGEAGGGASGRNAGFLLAGPEAHYAESVAAHGRARAREVWALNRANRDGVARLARRLGLDCELETTGSLVAAATAEEAEVLQRSFELMREDGFPATPLSADEADAAAGARGLHGALLVEDDAQLHPARFVKGLAEAARRAGARVHERAPVRALARDGDGWVARLDGGVELRAPTVVCGLNAYAPALLAWARDRVFPVRGQVLATAPLPQGSGGPRRPVYADHGYLYVRSYGRRVVAGGLRPLARAEEVGTAEALNATIQDALARELARLWPAAAGAPVTHRWSGAMGFSRDGLPWVGEVPGEPGLLVAVGYTGHGWGYGPWAGEVLAARAAGGKPAIPPWMDAGRPLSVERAVF